MIMTQKLCETLPMVALNARAACTFFVGLSLVTSEGGSLSIAFSFSSDRHPATPPSSKSLPNHRNTVSGLFFGAAEASSVRWGGSSHACTPYRGVTLCPGREGGGGED